MPSSQGHPTVAAPVLPLPSPQSPGAGTRYRLLSLHARGGLGEVFVAHDEELQREVALKSLQPGRADDPESRHRFLLEAEITSRLEHPGVVPVYGLVCGSDGRPSYAMRFIRGESLADDISRYHKLTNPRERQLALQRLLGRFIGVCQVIAYAHSRDIIHRDIKPANVMLGEFGETLVVDWGLAKRIDAAEVAYFSAPSGEGQVTALGSVMGTPSYMSPEQAAGHNQGVGRHSDIYSLGATLYHLLTGRAPFDEKEVVTILEKVILGDFPRPREVRPDIPPALEAACLKAMSPRPQDRYASPLELAEDIEHHLADQPVSAYPEPWYTRLRRWAGRHRTLVVGAASALVVAVVALGVSTALLLGANRRADDARALAEDNEKAAQVAAGQAEHERDAARRTLELSLEEINRFSGRLISDPRMRERDLEEMQESLLGSGLKSARALLRGREDDPVLQALLAHMEGRLGHLHWQRDDYSKAAELYDSALRRLGRLCRKRPKDARLARERGAMLSELGLTQFEGGQVEEGLKSLEQARTALEKVAARPDASDDDRQALALARFNLGNIYREQNKFALALSLTTAALKDYQALADAAPDNEEFAFSVAQSHLNLAAVLHPLGKQAEAIAETEKALSQLRPLVEQDPRWPPYRFSLAVAVKNRASLEKDRPRKKEYFLAARELLEELARRSPGMPSYQKQLADLCESLSSLQAADGELAAAEQSLLLMREAASRMLTRSPKNAAFRAIDAEALLDLGDIYRYAGRHEESEKAFKQSIAAWQKLVEEDESSWRYKFRLGWAHNSLGILYRHMRQSKKAAEQHRKALPLREQLFKHDGKRREYRANLASSYTNLANHCPGPVTADEAEGLLKKAIVIQEKLIKEPIHNTQDVLDYAMSYNNLGLLYNREKRHDEAEKAWRKALSIREGLLKKKPGLVKVWDNLSMSYANLAAHYAVKEDQANFIDCLEKAAVASEKAVKLQPHVEEHVTRLARVLNNLGDALVDDKRPDDALKRFKRALEVLAPWEKKTDDLTPDMWRQVINAHSNYAERLSENKQYKEALAHHRRALEISSSRERPRLMYLLALTLARSGQHRAAVDGLLELLPRTTTPQNKFPLAGLYCVAIRAAREDPKLSAAQRKDVADLYARRAVELLRECHKGGLYREEVYLNALESSPSLSVLFGREDYMKLVEEVEEALKPGEGK
jgi:serine/threonine-protein kinase